MTVIAPSQAASDAEHVEALEVSVVIPCLNEAQSIEACVRSAFEAMARSKLAGEVVVADNGSTDGSGELALHAGARVVLVPDCGYGNAYRAGFGEARGTYIVMADADETYDFDDIPRFLHVLEDGADMVIGDRMRQIQPGAMSWHHRYLGNPALSGLLNLLFHTGVNDAHCGMRAFRRDRLERLELRTSGMEFASEMVVRAAKEHLDVRQIPIRYHPRRGDSKLSSFKDGWRHVRYLLLHAPTHLFVLPGAALALLGSLISATVLAHIGVLGRQWDLHTLIGGSLLLVTGAQLIGLGLCAHAYASYFMGERSRWFEWARHRWRLEHGLMAGCAVGLAGTTILAAIIVDWLGSGLGDLSQERAAIVGGTLLTLGIQIAFTSFFLSILGLRRA
ncbi:MAG TPA: glycosyltransferase family 2 protein [Solirubrobacteraceae bacterium]|jgi:glycosyltransferase involved in cell wall biosynthesis